MIITLGWLNNIPNFTSKLITNKNTILISTTKQKEKKEKKRGEKKKVRMIILG